MTFSKPFGFLARGRDDGSFKQIDGALKSASWIGQVSWLYWLHDRFMPLIGNWLGVNARHGSLRAVAAREVQGRKGRSGDHRDILEMLMEVHEAKPEEMNDMGVLSMATSNIFAGSDTTAISIGAVLYHLCKNPAAMEKLRNEIQSKKNEVENGDKTWPLGVALEMSYLQACMYEALRLHPAVGMSLPRVAPKGGIEVSGSYIPATVSTFGHIMAFASCLELTRPSLVPTRGSSTGTKTSSAMMPTVFVRKDGWERIADSSVNSYNMRAQKSR